jgi:hypothetical protein
MRALGYPLDSSQAVAHNLDYTWYHYRSGWVITIEEKTRNGKSSDSQLDAHGVIAQMLQNSSGLQVRTKTGLRPIEYRGHYIVVFEKTGPLDSKWVRINRVTFSGDEMESALKVILAEGKHPKVSQMSPEIRDYWTRSHKSRGIKVEESINAEFVPRLKLRQMTLLPETRQEELFSAQSDAQENPGA